MKKIVLLIGISIVATGLVGFSTVQKKGSVDYPVKITDNVNTISERSCFPCHTEPGNKLALMKLNFEKWGEYDAKKQIKKAGRMCSLVSKGSMPPKRFISDNPDKVLSKEEIKIVCDWAASAKNR